jgi:hypothetical protein
MLLRSLAAPSSRHLWCLVASALLALLPPAAGHAASSTPHELTLLGDNSVRITSADGSQAVFTPRFVVLRAGTDPKLQIRGGSPGGVSYNLTTWGKDDQPSPDPSLHVPDGSDPTLDQAFGADRTADLFRACPAAWMEARASRAVGEPVQQVIWEFEPTASFSLEAELSLPCDGTAPQLQFRFSPTVPGWYSVGYVGGPSATLDQADEIWQPIIWNEKRLPDQSYLTQAFRCTLPTALVTHNGVTTGVVADASEFPFMPLPTFRQNNPFGVAVRTPEGTAQAMLFAPVLGGEGSEMQAGARFSFTARLAVVAGDADTAYETIARSLYGFRDQRSNGSVSLNTTLDNMIAYGMSGYSEFDDTLRGATYSTDVPGAVKNVSSLHPLGAALVTDDPQIFHARARPMIEYILSREKFLFATRPDIQIQNPSWLLKGPCCPLSELTALSTISGGRCTPFLPLAEQAYGRDRVFNLTAVTRGDRWQNALALYRTTGDTAWRDRAIELADAYLNRRCGQPQTDFSDPDAEGMFFWPSWMPQWIELFELYETTGEQRYLEAAADAARDYAMFTWMCPAVPDGTVTVDESGKAPRYRNGDRYEDIAVTPSTVEAWRLSEMGLTPEGSGTCKGHRAIFNAHYAPFMLRLAAATGDPLLHDVARNAIIGRYANFPGYHINTDRSLVSARDDFPLRSQKQLNGTSSIHYNHIWPHIALLIDYLVADVAFRSNGQIDFPSHYAEGYAYLQSKVYGAAAGTFYGESDAWLWMPRGLLTLEDGRQGQASELNWIAARGNGQLFLVFTNQSQSPVLAQVCVAGSRVRLPGERMAQVWLDNQPADSIAVNDGCLDLTVSPGGITAVAIRHDGLETAFQHTLGGAASPWKVGRTELAFGGLTATILDFGETNTSAYVYLQASDRVLKEVVLSWRTSPEDRWQEVRDTTYPFEFTIPLAPAEQAFEFFVDATRVNGNPARSETGRLQRSAP